MTFLKRRELFSLWYSHHHTIAENVPNGNVLNKYGALAADVSAPSATPSEGL